MFFYKKLIFLSIILSFPFCSISAQKVLKGKIKRFIPKTFTVNFEQSFVSSLSGKIKKSMGLIDYKFPGKIKLEINKPDQIIYISNKKKSWHYTAPFIKGEPGQLTIRPKGSMLLSEFFDKLSYGLKNNKYYDVKKIKNNVVISFKSKTSEKLGINQGTLRFDGPKNLLFKNIKGIDIAYKDKKSVTIKFLTVKENPKFNNDHFSFTPPPNTRIAR